MNIFKQKYNEFTRAHTESSTQAATTSHADKAAQIFQDKPFSVEYAGLFTVAQVGQSIAQVVTLLTTAALVTFAIGHLLPTAGLFFALPVGIVVAFGVEVLKRKILSITAKNVIKYKCLICGYEHDYDDTWSDEKKEQIKTEVDTHHNEHINLYE